MSVSLLSTVISLSSLAWWVISSIFMLTFIGLVVFCHYLLEKPPLEERIDKVVHHVKGGGSNAHSLDAISAQYNKNKAEQAKKKDPLSEKFLKRFRQKTFLKPDNLKTIFEQAGWSTFDAQSIYLFGKIGLLAVVGLMGYVCLYISDVGAHLNSSLKFYFLLFILGMGWYAFDVFLNSAIQSRVKRIEKALPNALDLLIICIQAGLSFSKGLERVARETVKYTPDVAREFATTSVELELLLDRRYALQNFSNRVPSPIVKTFTTTLIQSLQQGTPLLETLEVISHETRENKMQFAEEKAAKLPALMIIPLGIFILPNMFIVLLGPTIANLIKLV